MGIATRKEEAWNPIDEYISNYDVSKGHTDRIPLMIDRDKKLMRI